MPKAITNKLQDIGFYTLSDERAHNTSATSQMKRCELIINEYCNFRCPYCKGLDKSVFEGRKRKELSLEEIQKVIDIWCKDEILENIRFSGGEPTLHKDIIKIVAYAKEKGIKRIAISTNGSNKRELYNKLLAAGCNDFSISLDANDESTGDALAGGITGSWFKVVDNIKYLSTKTYVSTGVVLQPDNISKFIEIVNFASSLGVQDIRVIPSAQWNKPLPELYKIKEELLEKHPILRYRVQNFIKGKPIRGLNISDTHKCPLVLDDSVVAGTKHYPCVIYMREQGEPIGEVQEDMRKARASWYKTKNTHTDIICRNNCLDVCVAYNNLAQSTSKI